MTNSSSKLDIMPQLMTVANAAKYLKCHEETVRRAIRDKSLECYCPKRRYMISIEQLQKFLEASLCPTDKAKHQGSSGVEEDGQSYTIKMEPATDFRLGRQMNKALGGL